MDRERRAESNVIQNMTDTMVHRGPDNGSYYLDGNVALGHRRLSIIDLSESANQPLCNEDQRVWVVFNGELYNFRTLRRRLREKGHRFRSQTDTEVIVHGYEEWGVECFERFDGMMAVAIYDKIKKRIVIAKDRFGKKPLYYTLQNGVFAFASELKALIAHPAVQAKISSLAIERYLAYEYVPTPETIFENIYKLDAAQYGVIATQGEAPELAIHDYWQLAFEPKYDISIDEACQQFRELLVRAVEKRLISDVPLGVFLSGGIDSTSITWAMAEITEAKNIQTFSIGFREKSFDESNYARQAADYFGTRHRSRIFNVNTLLESLPEVIRLLDEPLADASILPTYLLSGFTQEYVTVALGGDGGDELFAGYDPFIAHRIARVVEHFPPSVLSGMRWFAKRLPISDKNMSFDFRMRHFMKGLIPEFKGIPELRNQAWLGPFEPRRYLKPRNGNHSLHEIYAPTIKRMNKWLKDVDRLSSIYIKTYMHDDILVKIDRASMMNSLEVRSPFLDTELAEFAARLPAHFKIKGLTTKYIMKRALRGYVPDSILHRNKKGFGIPLSKWLRNDLTVASRTLGRKLPKYFPHIFDKSEINNMVSNHQQGLDDARKEIWTMMMLDGVCLSENKYLEV